MYGTFGQQRKYTINWAFCPVFVKMELIFKLVGRPHKYKQKCLDCSAKATKTRSSPSNGG